MWNHGKVGMVVTGLTTLALVAGCGRDGGPGELLGPPAAGQADAVASGQLTSRIRIFAATGEVLHESTTVRDVQAVLARGVARVDNGSVIAMLADTSVHAPPSVRSDASSRAWSLETTTADGLPASATVRVNGDVRGRVALEWTRHGDVSIVTGRTVTVYGDSGALAEERSWFRPARDVHLSEAERAQQLRDWRQHPVMSASVMAGCGDAWGWLDGSGVKLGIASVAYGVFGDAALPFYQAALTDFFAALTTLIFCVVMMI
jgi:hypothetical protein